MTTTSVSLLQRLKTSAPDDSDWSRLQDIYLPLIRSWLSKVPGLRDEQADLAQEVFAVTVREIPRFERQRDGSFRAWLRQVTVNRVRTYHKQARRRPALATDGFIDQLADPHSDLPRQWDLEHDRHVFRKLSAIVQSDFNPNTWAAFQRLALDGIPAAETAAELGMSENAVLQAKSRVLKRLRAEAGELLD